jgi:hypothetical protein
MISILSKHEHSVGFESSVFSQQLSEKHVFCYCSLVAKNTKEGSETTLYCPKIALVLQKYFLLLSVFALKIASRNKKNEACDPPFSVQR